MAVKPGYITGASAKIKIFGATMAYATDVGYTVTVQTIPIESMGKFEVHSNEPVAYSVDGSFSIIRYAKQAKLLVGGDAAANGNSMGQNGTKPHLDPSTILDSNTFDLEIYQKQSIAAAAVTATATVPASPEVVDAPWLKVSDCRITRRSGSLSKRGVLVESFSFVGVLLHDGTGAVIDQVGNSGEEDLKI